MLKDFAVYNLESSQPVGGSDWQYRLSYNAVVSEACSPNPRPALCGAHSFKTPQVDSGSFYRCGKMI